MNGTTRTLRRLGVAGVAAVTFASPLLLAQPAFAAAGTVTLEDPTFSASYRNDGTNTTVHLYATINQATGTDPQIGRVRFTQRMTAPTNATTPTTICEDTTAPYACEWQPTAPGTYDITAEAREANGTQIAGAGGTDTRAGVVVSDNASSVHFTRPPGPDGGQAGYYAFFGGPTGPGAINVAGTRSSDLPGLTVTAANQGPANPQPAAITPDPDAGGAGTVPQGAPGLQAWSTDVGLPTTGGFTAPTGDTGTATRTVKRLRAQTDATNPPGSQEVVPAEVYLQKLASLVVTPSSRSAQPGNAAANTVKYTVTARDQKGNPISNLGLTIAKNSASQATLQADAPNTAANGQSYAAPFPSNDPTVSNRCNNRTDSAGNYSFAAFDTAAEQTTFTITSNFDNDANCTTDNAVDFSVTATLNTIQNASSATVSITPNLPIYDTILYGTDPAGAPTEYPVVKVRVNDQNGQPITNGPSGTVVQSVRTFTYCGNNQAVTPTNCGLGAAGTNPTTTTADAGNTDANGDVQINIPQVPNPDSAGNDVFTVYIEKTGTPGFQTGDTQVATVTLKFGPPHIFFQPCDQQTFNGTPGPGQYTSQVPPSNCNQPAQANQNKTVTFRYTIFDGTAYVPVAARAIDVTITGNNATPGPAYGASEFGFTTTQPSGSTRNSATSVTTTTDNNGVGSATLTAARTGTVTVQASDPLLGTNTFEDGTTTVDFRNNQVTLTSAKDRTTCGICDAFDINPTNFHGNARVGSPGAPLLSQVQLLDQNGAPLQNSAVRLTTTAGFFTPLPNNRTATDQSYANLSFTNAPVNNALITGDLVELGKTLDTVTDANGVVTFALGIKRDAGFDDDGRVNGTVAATVGSTTLSIPVGQNGPNGTGAAPSVGGVLFSTDSNGFGVTVVNPSATQPLEIRQGTFDNAGNFQLGTGKPSGDVATARDLKIPTDVVAFVVFQRDVYGNLVNSGNLNVTETGPGNIVAGSNPRGAYADPSTNFFGNDIVVITNPGNAAPQTGAETVTVDWPAPKNTFLVGANGQKSTNSSSQTISDNFTVTWYVREVAGLKFTTTLTPASAQNPGTVQTGTTVGVSVTVVDAKNRPVQGLQVQFLTAGPGANTTQSPACNPTSGGTQATQTDQSGRAGYQYASNTEGRSTITTVITDTACNELGRDVRTVTFSGQGSQPASGTVSINGPSLTRISVGSTVSVSGKADPGAKVNLYFRQRNTATFVDRRDLTASSAGVWSTTYTANDDYQYFAAVGSSCPATIAINGTLPSGCVASARYITQAVPYIDGPPTRPDQPSSPRRVTKGSTVTITGHYVVGTDALVLATINQQPVGSKSGFGKALGGGRFSYTYVADRDYRFYVPRKLSESRDGLLSWVVQAR